VTFVPVSRKRRRERGYNQAELIARSFGRSVGVQVKGLLAVSGEGNQKRMHYHERFLNMVGRFSGTTGLRPGMSVLLVDDVFTTGATVNECARILKKMGASSVFSLTIARVDDRKAKVVALSRRGFSQKS
jgi:ComF family protein